MFVLWSFKSYKTILASFGGLILLFYASLGLTDSPKADPAEVPLSITSKNMVARQTDRMVIFEGDVVLTKGEFTLTADRLEVTLAPAGPEDKPAENRRKSVFEVSRGKEAISMIEAIGNVQIAQGDRHGKAERAVYDQKDDKVILTGQPEVWERDYRVSGKKMIFFLREQKNVVEEGKAIVYPQKE
jgi:lipopolysaccharide export system protein LptA